MTPELGFFALVLAFMLAVAQSVVPLIGAMRRNETFMEAGHSYAAGQFAFILFSFGVLTYSFVVSDFSVKTVAENSHTTQPMLYKVSGTWGNHEGSMLLWVLILSLFGWCVAQFGRDLPSTLKARVLAVQGMIGAGFLAFIIFTSNPFARLTPAPLDGAELNPLLQDPGLAFHPPFLYLGYVGFSIAFSFSVAALMEGRVDSAWARWVRPWVLAAWCFLTIGIALGSWWAYYELGWGGWWFWDPVENASFMPWLVGTALLHSALVVERRQTMVNWTILLGIVAFTLSLIGTFLVRSGVLTSVHAFAQDPSRGVFILLLLLITSCSALTLYAWRSRSLETGPTFAPVSREGALVLNNILLVAAVATVFLGTFYPLVIDALGDDKISVGPPFYNKTFVPIMIPLLLAMAVGPLLKWRKDGFGRHRRVLIGLGACAALTVVAISPFAGSILPAFGMGLAVWVILGSLWAYARKLRLHEGDFSASLKLARALPGATYGLLIAHLSTGICVAGIVAMSSWAKEDIRVMQIGDMLELSGYQITLKSVGQERMANYRSERAHFALSRSGNDIATVVSETRFYPVRRQQTTEAGIRAHPFINLYVSLGEQRGQAGWVVRSYYHPLASMIWFGALGMALGGFISLSDRRFRLGARTRSAIASSPAASSA